MPDSKISALPSGIPAQAGDQFPIARSGLNYSLTPVTLASAFTNLGAWQAVQTSSFTAAVGKAYPINTTSAAITVTLPSSATRGDVIYLADYAGTFATNNLTIQPNFNGYKLNGSWAAGVVSTNRAALQLVYSDATQGWLCYTDTIANLFSSLFTVKGLVVAGGGGKGGTNVGGAGGGGGFRTYLSTYPLSPSPGTIETGTVTVGAGGAEGPTGSNGANSVLNTITSAGGGGGGDNLSGGSSGGSGGGNGGLVGGNFAVAGNVPATTPPQGYPGNTYYAGGAGSAAIGGYGQPGSSGVGNTSTIFGSYTSVTSNTIGAGSKTFNINTGISSSIITNTNVRIYYDSSNFMDGSVTSYDSGTGVLVVNVIQTTGSGTYSSWYVNLLYAQGGTYVGSPGIPQYTAGFLNNGRGGSSGNFAPGSSRSGTPGVVLISVPNTASVTFSGGVTSTMTTVGTNKVYKVTATSTTSETYTVTVP